MTALSERLATHFADPEADASLLTEALGGLASLGYQPPSNYLGGISQILAKRLKDCSATDLSR